MTARIYTRTKTSRGFRNGEHLTRTVTVETEPTGHPGEYRVMFRDPKDPTDDICLGWAERTDGGSWLVRARLDLTPLQYRPTLWEALDLLAGAYGGHLIWRGYATAVRNTRLIVEGFAGKVRERTVAGIAADPVLWPLRAGERVLGSYVTTDPIGERVLGRCRFEKIEV